ncbi:hypothetical protein BDN70DRAFT_709875 [Pholiota conissans]|uniref:Fungal-type protein kinase domain-containing protein n=1 Tax=Pholiota conissans TaxID=109636 RepID=A0A9P5Z1T7_9AGAR|nr:hypothetical protein BDN70DRAFT_709875 [Pholiota conissans]
MSDTAGPSNSSRNMVASTSAAATAGEASSSNAANTDLRTHQPEVLLTQSTPMKAKRSSVKPFSAHQPQAKGREREHSREMVDKFVGPMPVEMFFKEFLKPPRTKDKFKFEPCHRQKMLAVTKKKKEKAMYVALIDALKPFMGKFELIDTHDNPDTNSGALAQEDLKPDVTLYHSNCGRSRVTDMSKAEVAFELKNSKLFDAFRDLTNSEQEEDNKDFVRRTTKAKETAGQLTSYAVAQFAAQFRTHLFSVLILKNKARLIYWDRAGAVVTQLFDLTEKYLAQFVWRYTRSTDKIRGMDTTVTKPTAQEIISARLYLDLDDNVIPDDEFVKFKVIDEETKAARYFIGKRPAFKRNCSLVGRASRGYVVWDPITNVVMFLKDT